MHKMQVHEIRVHAKISGGLKTLRDLRDHLPEWVAGDDPRAVKFLLSKVVKLTAFPNKTIRAELV